MSVFQSPLDSFSLNSSWSCSLQTSSSNPAGTWTITNGPHAASKTLTFPVSIPAGSVIARAWIKAKVSSSPLGGIQYFRINGEDVPTSGEFDISITPSATSFSAAFSFASWGVVFSDTNVHYGTLTVETPTLVIDYVGTESGGTGSEEIVTAASKAKALRLPRLLGADLREAGRLQCTSLSLELNLDPLSTASMTLPHTAPVVAVDDFVELFTPYGSAGIFRVYRTDEKVGSNRRCELRHAIVTLADDLVTAGNAIAAPVAQVFASLFAMQTTPRWAMGICETPDGLEMVLERNYQTILTAFSELTANLPDGYAWEFDQTTTPWRANLRRMSEDDSCEFRMTRNVKDLHISTDRDNQCTRVYAFGAGEGEERIGLTSLIGTPYLDADGINERGVIAKTITNKAIFDSLTLKDVAERYLDRHKDPDVSIRVDAVNVYKLTGLTFDKFHMGKICRIPLPGTGRTVRERVISIAWRDVVGRPEDVEATLSTRLRNASDELAELMREATGSKLIGGTVQSVETEYRNDSVTQTDALVHYFDITGYGNVLAVLAEYIPAGACRLNVDSLVDIPLTETDDGKVDLLRYLKSDGNGVPTVGRHYVTYFAKGTDYVNVYSKVTVKSIEKKGGGGSSYVPSTSGYFITSEGDYLITSDGNKFKAAEGTESSSSYQLITWNGDVFTTTDGNNYKVLGG